MWPVFYLSGRTLHNGREFQCNSVKSVGSVKFFSIKKRKLKTRLIVAHVVWCIENDFKAVNMN